MVNYWLVCVICTEYQDNILNWKVYSQAVSVDSGVCVIVYIDVFRRVAGPNVVCGYRVRHVIFVS